MIKKINVMNEKGIPKKITAEKQWQDKNLVYR